MMHSLPHTLIWWYIYIYDTCLYKYNHMMMNMHGLEWWHSSMHYDVYLLHTHYLMMMMVHTLWLWCIIYDDVQKQQSRDSSVIVDDNEQCVAVISTGMIWQWLECRGYQQQSLVCDRCTSSTIFFLSGCQDGARKGGRSLLPVEAEKLGRGSFLQVAACNSGGRSLLPVEAGKLKSI